jgi:hypothetical protein
MTANIEILFLSQMKFQHSHIMNHYKFKQYYEKQVTLRGGHIQEGKGKIRKLKR